MANTKNMLNIALVEERDIVVWCLIANEQYNCLKKSFPVMRGRTKGTEQENRRVKGYIVKVCKVKVDRDQPQRENTDSVVESSED